MASAPEFDYFDIVTLRDTDSTRHFGVVGMEGVVLGWGEEDDGTISGYGVYFDSVGMIGFDAEDLQATGRKRPREEIYDGSHIRVSKDGEPLPYE